MKSKKMIYPLLGALIIGFGLQFGIVKNSEASDNHRVFREGKDYIGCYEPGGNCYSDVPVEN